MQIFYKNCSGPFGSETALRLVAGLFFDRNRKHLKDFVPTDLGSVYPAPYTRYVGISISLLTVISLGEIAQSRFQACT